MGSGKARPQRRMLAALAALAQGLDELPGKGMIIGGVAAIAHGVPRVTRDIDATVSRQGHTIEEIIEVMGAHDIRPRVDDAAAFALESSVLLLEHDRSGVEVDLSLASLPFEHEALQASQPAVISDTLVRLARPEDLVIYKSASWRPQDQQDVERLIELHGSTMNVDRVRRLVGEICAVLDVPERIDELEDMLRSVNRGHTR